MRTRSQPPHVPSERADPRLASALASSPNRPNGQNEPAGRRPTDRARINARSAVEHTMTSSAQPTALSIPTADHEYPSPRLLPSLLEPGPGGIDTTTLTPVQLARAEKPARLPQRRKHARSSNPWACSWLTLAVTAIAALLVFLVMQSFHHRQLDPKGCAMSYMRPTFIKLPDFDTEHSRLASKYSLYLYREAGVDEDPNVHGIPILFIPGNAGSYKQVRPFAAEAAIYFQDNLAADPQALRNGKRQLDFFTVDFNEDITAFHGQTLIDQAEYLNEAVSYILSLYTDPARSDRDADLPDPTSVILLGHSMGGIVARTMLIMPNYQSKSINTILTLAAPHARAPLSFDSDIVRIYKHVNDYWRHSYSQKWASNNPLWHVTLISIAGGGLDTVVPSDYSAVSSLLPPTHGFTVFTSTIPNVWTSMDHLAITWCDQLRRSIVRALYDVVDAQRPSQTRPRADRMHAFKHWFLTGFEHIGGRTSQNKEPRTLLTLDDESTSTTPLGQRLVLRQLGLAGKARAHLLPVPSLGEPERMDFTLLTDRTLNLAGDSSQVRVLVCSVFPPQSGHSSSVFPTQLDLSRNGSETKRLACKNAASDVIPLPASTSDVKFPFESGDAFSFLRYRVKDLVEYQYVAVIDESLEPTSGWAVAEFGLGADSIVHADQSLSSLISSGIHVVAPADRPTLMEIKISSIQSSLLAYRLSLAQGSYGREAAMFMPLLRQYISEPYESKFFVNVTEADISLHGIAPYIPPPFRGGRDEESGLALQIWSDPTCNTPLEITLQVDVLGSLGKLWMRYRTVFAAFPLLVVALVLRKQFNAYDLEGTFLSFSEGMDLCIRRSIPLLFFSLTMLATSFSGPHRQVLSGKVLSLLFWQSNTTTPAVDYTKNDLLLGSSDAFFWFLVPLFGIISIGICVALNYLALLLTYILAVLHTHIQHLLIARPDARHLHRFSASSLHRRVAIIAFPLLLVSTIIPYQFVYIILCLVQLATSVRALSLSRESRTLAHLNFSNYAHSLLVLLLWILPLNIPALIVWARNLALLHAQLLPLSSSSPPSGSSASGFGGAGAPLFSRSIPAIAPLVLLVETLTAGRMVPRLRGPARHCTNVLFFALALYAGVYGVTYAYLLHPIVNIVCAWLVVIYFVVGGGEGAGVAVRRPLDGLVVATPTQAQPQAAAKQDQEQAQAQAQAVPPSASAACDVKKTP